MSTFIDTLIMSIDNAPESFRHITDANKKGNEFWIRSDGIEHMSKDLRIINYGNFPAPIITVYINGKEVPHNIGDAYRLEFAVKRWFKRISLEHLIAN